MKVFCVHFFAGLVPEALRTPAPDPGYLLLERWGAAALELPLSALWGVSIFCFTGAGFAFGSVAATGFVLAGGFLLVVAGVALAPATGVFFISDGGLFVGVEFTFFDLGLGVPIVSIIPSSFDTRFSSSSLSFFSFYSYTLSVCILNYLK